jgi:hypothetical protein
MSGGQALRHWSNLGVTLVEFIVHEDVLLIHDIVDNTLVDVLSSREGKYRYDVGCVANLVRGIVDGDRILIVSVTDVATFVALVGTSIDDALRVVDVTVTYRLKGSS